MGVAYDTLRPGLIARQVRMRPCMTCDGVTCRCDLLKNLGMPQCLLADREEDGLRALLCQRIEHGPRVLGRGTVVESEHDFFQQQKVVLLVLREAERGWARGFHFDRERVAERVGGVTGDLWLRWSRP